MTMLYKIFNSLKEAHGQDYFTSRVSDLPTAAAAQAGEIVQNLLKLLEKQEKIIKAKKSQFQIGL